MKSLKKQQAADIISEHFLSLKGRTENEDVLVSAREAGRKLVEVYRLLTNEMPQSPGIDIEFEPDEMPAVEFASPLERDPGEVFYVHPGIGNDPDILLKGDQDGSTSNNSTLPNKQTRGLLRGRRQNRS